MIRYKDILIASNTKAAELHDKKNFQELDKHIKSCLAAQNKLENGSKVQKPEK